LGNGQSLSLLYNKRLTRKTNVIVRAVRRWNSLGQEDSIYFSFNALLGRRTSASYSQQDSEQINSKALLLQRSAPMGSGVGGRARLWADEALESTENLKQQYALTWKTKPAIFDIDYYHTPTDNNFQTSVAGSLAFVENGFYFSRPIQDSFSLVKLGSLDDVRVYYSNELMGETRHGRLLIPNLVSYSPNFVSIEAGDIPVDVSLTRTRQFVTPKFRSAAIASFDVEHLQSFVGSLIMDDFGRRHPVEFGHLELFDGQSSRENRIGKAGEFYLENLSPGDHAATITWKDKVCKFRLKIPQSTDVMVDLGEITCVR